MSGDADLAEDGRADAVERLDLVRGEQVEDETAHLLDVTRRGCDDLVVAGLGEHRDVAPSVPADPLATHPAVFLEPGHEVRQTRL